MELGPDPGLLLTLRQDDWDIRYEAYARFGELTLPTRLHLQRDTTSVRLIIRQWQLAAG
jgi:outer membrane biogenesis lipoprotein LolB